MRRPTAAAPKRDHGHLRKERTGAGGERGEAVEPESIPPLQTPRGNRKKKDEAGEGVTFCSSSFNMTSTQCPVLGGHPWEELVVFFWSWTQVGI
jgi:hypothetical protein